MYFILFSIVIILIGLIAFSIKSNFFNNTIEAENKNSKKAEVSLTAKDKDGKKYTGNKWTTKVTMTATLDKKSSESLKYTWYKDGKKYSSCTTNTCVITSTTYSKFAVKIKKGLITYDSNSLLVQVDAVDVNYKLELDKNVLRLSTNQSPRSGVSFLWYRNGTLLKNEKNHVINISNKPYELYTVKVTSGVGKTKTYNYENPLSKIKATKYFYRKTKPYESSASYDGEYTFWDEVKLEGSYEGNIKKYYWTKDDKTFSDKKNITISSQQNSKYCFVVETKSNKKTSKCMAVKIDRTDYDMYITINGKRSGIMGTGEGISSKFRTVVNISDSINVVTTKTPSCGSKLTVDFSAKKITFPYKWDIKKKNMYYMLYVKDCAGRTYYTSIGLK